MTIFTRDWNAAYQAIPANSEGAKQGAQRIRELKEDLKQRMIVDHEWNGDEHDGKHAVVHMRPQTSDPVTMAGHGQLYSKLQGTGVELYFKDSLGNVFPITSAGGGVANIILPGTIIMVGNGVDADGVSYIQCDGRAISRTTYGGLFLAIGTLWGSGDGILTFNVPDLRGRSPIGRGHGTGLSNRLTGQVVGAETHTIDITQIPGHQHAVRANNAGSSGGAATAFIRATAEVGPGMMTESAGGNGAGISQPHNNMQPSAVINYWIKT